MPEAKSCTVSQDNGRQSEGKAARTALTITCGHACDASALSYAMSSVVATRIQQQHIMMQKLADVLVKAHVQFCLTARESPCGPIERSGVSCAWAH